jgi:hypothetical protein
MTARTITTSAIANATPTMRKKSGSGSDNIRPGCNLVLGAVDAHLHDVVLAIKKCAQKVDQAAGTERRATRCGRAAVRHAL